MTAKKLAQLYNKNDGSPPGPLLGLAVKSMMALKRCHRKPEGCIAWNDTIQYSPEAVRYPCTRCLLPAFDDAWCHVPATE